MLVAESASLLLRDLAFLGVFLNEVKLVSHKHDAQVLFSLQEEGLKPEFNIFKGLALSYIVDNQRA